MEHLNSAEKRYKRLKTDEHLTTEYFSNYYDELLNIIKNQLSSTDQKSLGLIITSLDNNIKSNENIRL